MRIFLIVVLCLSSISCATTARKFTIEKEINGKIVTMDILELKGMGKAKYPDGSSIEGEPLLKIPDTFPIKFEQ